VVIQWQYVNAGPNKPPHLNIGSQQKNRMVKGMKEESPTDSDTEVEGVQLLWVSNHKAIKGNPKINQGAIIP
jgi:hypothetical protein